MLLGLTFLKPTPFLINHSCILLFNWFSFVWHCILWTFFWNFLQNSSILTASCTAFIFGWVHALGAKMAYEKCDLVTWKTHPFRFGIFWQFPLLTSESIKLENLRNFCSIRPNEIIKSPTVHWYLLPCFHYKPFILIASRESGISPRSSIRSLTLCWISFFSPCWGPLIKLTTGASSF